MYCATCACQWEWENIGVGKRIFMAQAADKGAWYQESDAPEPTSRRPSRISG